MSRHHDDHGGSGATHPVATFVAGLEAALKDLVDVPVWSLDGESTEDLLARVIGARAGLAELEARLITHAEAIDRPGSIGARSTSAWLRRLVPLTAGEAHRTSRLARELDTHEQTRVAAAAGRVLPDQAARIVAAVDELDPNTATWPRSTSSQKRSITTRKP